MKARKASLSIQAVQVGVVLAGLLAPLLASAQFVLVSQSASANATAVYGPPASAQSLPGDTSNLSLRVDAGKSPFGEVSGSVETFAEPGRMGISGGSGGSPASLPYYCDVNGCYSGGGSSASVQLYFDVTTDVDAQLTGSAYYNALTPSEPATKFHFGTYVEDLQFEHRGADGKWVSVQSPANVLVQPGIARYRTLTGDVHLSAGSYRMLGSWVGYVGDSMSIGGAGLTITAVPEPTSAALMGLGLIGMLSLARRRA
jgi:hypothetical protein